MINLEQLEFSAYALAAVAMILVYLDCLQKLL